MLKNLIHKNYLIFGGSIIATRALEYIVLFFAAHYLSKDNYGELEYYKKIIEVGSSVFAFGFPALIISYTKSEESKKYFFFLSILFVLFLALILAPFLSLFNHFFLLIPFIFYAIFFNGGITPAFLLVKKGSNYASIYKIVVSFLFYIIIFISLKYFNVTGKAYVFVTYILSPLTAIYLIYILLKQRLIKFKIKKYWKLFRKLLASSFTLVISNFANLMFLYTDIFIIKLLSNKANSEIADFSFALNIANMLLLIPLTLVQVDIEKLKNIQGHLNLLNKKIVLLILIASVFLIGFYKILIFSFFIDYNETFVLFLLILFAKVFHSLSTLFGTNLLIFKKYKENLIVNLSMLLLNIVLCYFLYKAIGILGVAIASSLSLFVRYIILIKLNLNYINNVKN